MNTNSVSIEKRELKCLSKIYRIYGGFIFVFIRNKSQ